MPRVCMLTGKGTVSGNNVAHCNKKTKRTFKANLHWKRVWVESENRFIRLLLSQKALRTIFNKIGVDHALTIIRANGYKV